MFVQPIDYFLAIWFVLAALSTAYVAWDQVRTNPEPAVALIQLQRERFAVLRALGASRAYIFVVVWTGVTAMVVAGAILGLGLGYIVAQILSTFISRETGVAISATLGQPELVLAGLLILLGGLVALVPAVLVHRQPVVDLLRS